MNNDPWMDQKTPSIQIMGFSPIRVIMLTALN